MPEDVIPESIMDLMAEVFTEPVQEETDNGNVEEEKR